MFLYNLKVYYCNNNQDEGPIFFYSGYFTLCFWHLRMPKGYGLLKVSSCTNRLSSALHLHTITISLSGSPTATPSAMCGLQLLQETLLSKWSDTR